MSPSKTYRYGVITNEIDQDFERACQVASEEGMQFVEIGTLWDKAVEALTDAEIEQAKYILDDRGLGTHLICGLFFRPFSLADVDLDTIEDHPRFREHMDRLEQFIRLAHYFHAPNIRTFGFTRDEGGTNPSPRSADGGGITDETFAKIVKGLQIACDRLSGEGLTLALENARSLYANTGGNMGRLLDAVNRPNLKIIWDPANAFVAGENPAEGFQHIKGQIADVHCKDATLEDPETGLTAWARIGTGETDWANQLQLLQAESIDVLTIETHWHPEGQDRAENTRQTFSSLKQILEQSE
jgi:sugar phosphate isomerase/epimerase